ncbi:MAG: Glycosyl transferase family 2 protein [Parcubacteria group bacterium GW2011_GWC2_38_7]|nr:MAG: Glycosyl transferase family 2 protein [Parcubacteria group bacterium GW2011_GWC2_38_7]
MHFISSPIKVCIVVPMFNEERIARISTETIIQYTKALPPTATLLVVNDGSRDKTEDIIKTIAAQYQPKDFTVLSHATNRGYGAALKTGIRYAVDNKYDYVLFMDSDLTNHPKYLHVFYEKMIEGWDYIKASRYAKGGRVEGVPWLHRVISIVGNHIARHLYGLQ